MGSEKGELAILDLTTMGVIQRIPSTLPRMCIQGVVFPSQDIFLVIATEGRDHTHVYKFVLAEKEKGKDNKWERVSMKRLKDRVVCTVNFEYFSFIHSYLHSETTSSYSVPMKERSVFSTTPLSQPTFQYSL